jgi:hypothetical protein
MPFAVAHPFGLPWSSDEVGLMAAVLTALATAVLAALTVWVMRANSDMVAEVQKDRELSARPYMTFYSDQSGFKPPNPPAGFSVYVANFGRGPALKCFYCARFDLGDVNGSIWYPSAIRDFAPTIDLLGLETRGAASDATGLIILQGLAPGEKAYTEALVCIDQFGMRYRFRSDRETPDLWKPGQLITGWEKWFPMPGEDY